MTKYNHLARSALVPIYQNLFLGCCQQACANYPSPIWGLVRGYNAASGDGQGEEAAGDETDQGEM